MRTDRSSALKWGGIAAGAALVVIFAVGLISRFVITYVIFASALIFAWIGLRRRPAPMLGMIHGGVWVAAAALVAWIVLGAHELYQLHTRWPQYAPLKLAGPAFLIAVASHAAVLMAIYLRSFHPLERRWRIVALVTAMTGFLSLGIILALATTGIWDASVFVNALRQPKEVVFAALWTTYLLLVLFMASLLWINRPMHVFLVGPPNSGKTKIAQAMLGQYDASGNYDPTTDTLEKSSRDQRTDAHGRQGAGADIGRWAVDVYLPDLPGEKRSQWLEAYLAKRYQMVVLVIDPRGPTFPPELKLGDLAQAVDDIRFAVELFINHRAAQPFVNSVLVVVNKHDLWGPVMTLPEVVAPYAQELDRLRAAGFKVVERPAVSWSTERTAINVAGVIQQHAEGI